MSRKLRVFLCHATEDRPATRELYKKLAAEPWIQPWMDTEDLLPGQDFDLEIYKALRDSDAILICLSQTSVAKSGYLNKEIRRALDTADEKPEGAIYIIPVKFDDCTPAFEKLKKYQWVNYYESGAHERLIKSLQLRAEVLEIDTTAKQIDQPSRKRKLPVWALPLIVLGLISLSIWGLYQLRAVFAASTSTPSPTEWPVTESPTSIKLPTQTSTTTPTETPAEPSLGIGSTMIGRDGMVLVYVPAGEFLMGSADNDPIAHGNEKPQHIVTLDAFWIDQTEVTNTMYAKCVASGLCQEPMRKDSNTRSSYYGNPAFDNYPVIFVDWNMARTYCTWAGRDLPSEAQWEKAARSIDGRTYPWGEGVDLYHANYNYLMSPFGDGDTTSVAYYQNGKSVFDVYDMAGNVWEWVKDWFGDMYYLHSPLENPIGPDLGKYRVLRGGSWISSGSDVRSAVRYWRDPLYFNLDLGFRCALSISNP